MELKFCPFYGEKWEGCRKCLSIDKEENPAPFENCFPSNKNNENELHSHKCMEVRDIKEYEVNGEIRYKVFCGATQKWIENWKSYWEEQGKSWY